MDSGALSDCKKSVGLRESLKMVKNEMADTVYVAKDAERRVVADIINLCQEQGIPIIEVESMEILGKACSVQVGTAVAARLKESPQN